MPALEGGSRAQHARAYASLCCFFFADFVRVVVSPAKATANGSRAAKQALADRTAMPGIRCLYLLLLFVVPSTLAGFEDWRRTGTTAEVLTETARLCDCINIVLFLYGHFPQPKTLNS